MITSKPKPDGWDAELDYLIPMVELVHITGLSRASIYNLIQAGRFPRPLKPSPGASRWIVREVRDWLQERSDDRDKR